MKRRSGLFVVLGAVLGVILPMNPAPALAQLGGVGVAITPSFSSPVVAGQQAVPALLQFTNFSFGAAARETVTLSGIQINPSCAASQPVTGGSSPCSAPEPRPNALTPVLHLGTTSAAGTTCPGGPFSISGPDGDGDFTFTPNSGPVTLAPVGSPGSSCDITFTFNAVQRPNDGATSVVAVTRAASPSAPSGVVATGTTSVTVNPSESRYTALSPARIEDTRSGAGGLKAPLGSGATVDVQVSGRGGVPSAASAVVLNVTVTQPTAEGFLTLYPAGTARPLSSNLNFTPAKTVPNLVVVKLGADGRVAMFNSAGSTHVIFDVAGYFVAGAGNAGRYQPLVPARIADTRVGAGGVRLGPGQSFDLQVTGQGGAPASGVAAAVLNVAATGTTAESYLTVYPAGEPRPLAANLNFRAGDTVSNRTMTKLGAGGKVTIYNNAGAADVVVDIGGTYTDASVAGSTGGYTPLAPRRLLDTRDGPGPIPADGTVEPQVAGVVGVPAADAKAVVLSVTVTRPVGHGYLTIFPSGTARPLASDLNYANGETRANLVVVQLGANGKVGLFTSAQSHVVIDVAGYFT